MIGLYGPILFHSGTTGLQTFDEMKKTVTARWGTHDVWLQKPLLEYSGPQLIEITFRMELIKPFTADPLMSIIMLEEIMDLATPLPLVIGMKPMGRGLSMFVLTSLSHQMKYFYRNGGLLGASVEVQLKEYVSNPLSNLMKALGGLFGGGQSGGVAGAAQDTQAVTGGDAVGQEQAAFNASVDKSLPQLAQNAGNPVPVNLGFGGSSSGLPAATGAYAAPPGYGAPTTGSNVVSAGD
jgi:phage protein U